MNLTADQRAAYKTRADKVQEIVREIEELDAARSAKHFLLSVEPFRCWSTATELLSKAMMQRVLKLGIDTLIAQLEQQLVDLDRPQQAAPGHIPLAAILAGRAEELLAPTNDLDSVAESLMRTEGLTVPPSSCCTICGPICRGHNDRPPDYKLRKMVPEEVSIDDCPRLKAALEGRIPATLADDDDYRSPRLPMVGEVQVRYTIGEPMRPRSLADESHTPSPIRWNAEKNILEPAEDGV